MEIGKPERVVEVPKPMPAPDFAPRKEPEREPIWVRPIRPAEPARVAPLRHFDDVLGLGSLPSTIYCPKSGCNNMLTERDTDTGLELFCSKHGQVDWKGFAKALSGR